MKKASSWLWGGVLIILGVVLGLNALGLTRVNVFFPGWWTLFIIIPCFINLFTSEHKGGAAFGLLLGVCLLLGCWGYLSFGMIWKLLLPVILVFIGLGVIAHSMSNSEVNEKIRKIKKERHAEHHRNHGHTTIRATVTEIDADGNQTKRTYSNHPKDDEEDINEIIDAEVIDGDDNDDDDEDAEYEGKEFWSTFSDQEINYKDKDFDGCRIDAVFGGADLDLRGAKIKNNSIVKTSSVFGGIIIYVPEDVKVEMTSTSIFGGINDKRVKSEKAKKSEKTIYIDATCVFGSVELR